MAEFGVARQASVGGGLHTVNNSMCSKGVRHSSFSLSVPLRRSATLLIYGPSYHNRPIMRSRGCPAQGYVFRITSLWPALFVSRLFISVFFPIVLGQIETFFGCIIMRTTTDDERHTL
ncbi:hypothetical protein N658DRAFT_358325 [Parathielavia hyrcaniae]|uniref:Uncharacterized protein n=1 Tax=Parathielavia hyrcaniae TaxID=113614 RepID=A0AAN6Q2A0_9PEZI|nr:hypothetical protein N658DRAFT_358325 [Parathielavia hyrcaniae]